MINPYVSIEPVVSWNQGREPAYGAFIVSHDEALGWEVPYDYTLPKESGVQKRGIYLGNNLVAAVDLAKPPTEF